MAIHNPNNLFSGGAVVFNPLPYQQLTQSILAKQQAKQDAMDKYQQSRISSVNDKGLRDIDRQGFDDRVLGLQQYYQANKDKILRGNTPESFNFEKMYRDSRDYVAKSQDLNARHEAAMGFYNNKLKIDQRLPDDFMVEVHKNDLPIDHPDTTPFDITKWSSTPPPFDADKYAKEFENIKRTPSAPTYQKTDNPFKKNEITVEKFDDKGKDTIAARAIDKYNNSYSFSTEVQNEIQNPVTRKKLSDLFTQEYGVEPKSPTDFAIAKTMEIIQPSITKQKTVDDQEALIRERAKYRVGRGGTDQPTINDVYSIIDNAATQSKVGFTGKGTPYLQVNLLPSDAQQVVIDYAKKVTGNNGLGNDDIKIIKDDNGKIGIFHAKGKLENQLIGYVTPTNVNIKTQPSVQEKRRVVELGNKPATSKPKKDPLGLF